MGLVAAKCPSCGANIQIPEEQDRCFCSYCGSQVLTEAAINFARVQVTGTVQTRAADFDVEAGVLKGYHGASTDVVIPEGVRTIASRAFANMPITSVMLPVSLTSVRFDDFRLIKTLQALHYAGDGNDWFEAGDVLYSAVSRELLFYPPAKRSESYVVGGGTKKVTITNNPYLRSLVIEDDASAFPELTISHCENLHEIVLPQTGITSIKVNGCPALERLDLPSFVQNVVVGDCNALAMVTTRSALDRLVISCCPQVCINEEGALDIPEGTAYASVSSERATRLVVRKGIDELYVTGPTLTSVEIGEGIEQFTHLRLGGLHGCAIKLPASLKLVDTDSFSASWDCTFDYPSMDTAVIHDQVLRLYRSNQWRNQGRCPLCGGKLRGLFKKRTCASCGNEILI